MILTLKFLIDTPHPHTRLKHRQAAFSHTRKAYLYETHFRRTEKQHFFLISVQIFVTYVS